ncbi:MAG: glycosyltransferase [candidate division Zixibacteria bacterium]|nr:glycosyltransferase [candidate division Zixibacteria bacterium]
MSNIASKYKLAIIMPVLNEELFIGKTLEQIYSQDFPMAEVEIVIADGGSSDKTKEIASSFKNRFGSLILLDNLKKFSSAGRNLGVKNSSAPYILILDGHINLPDKHLLSSIIDVFEKTDAKCLCSTQFLNPPDLIEFEKSIAVCSGSILGHRTRSKLFSNDESKIDPVSSCAIYRRDIFEIAGYFDERFDACADIDFNYRINKAELKSIMSPKLKISYYPKSSLNGLWQQMQRYGGGYFNFSTKHNYYFLPQLIAGAGVFGFLFLFLLSMLHTPAFGFLKSVFGIYLLVIILFSGMLTVKEKNIGCLIFGLLIFPTIHFGLGVGFWKQFYKKYLNINVNK